MSYLRHVVCLFVGHRPAVRANEVWSPVLQVWQPISPTHNAFICPRCGDVFGGWSLRYRA